MPHDPQLGEGIQVPLRWAEGADLPLVHADHVLLTFRGQYFVITIGQTAEPMLVAGDEEAIKAVLESGVSIRPLARFTVPADRMVEWAEVIHRHVQKFAPKDAEPDDA